MLLCPACQAEVPAGGRVCPSCGGVIDASSSAPTLTHAAPPTPAGITTPPASRLESGTTIGPYQLLRRIGEGGMGEVWLAEQREPIRRRVALKLIKWGMDTRAVIARFNAERQALALMDHPNVAKVFDAGSTDAGRPYFVMECVEGVSITEHCDRYRLTTEERLELFIRVCHGVQHAHHKGVIHRDIKPSNVLVVEQDGLSTPKIIDFGIAKATTHRLTEMTVFTEIGQMIGTPAYMSPEQAEMTVEDIDTRTDVYSLGVLLYELLTGFLPFDAKELRRAGIDEIRRRIREDEPSRPSTRILTQGNRATDPARNRRSDPRALARRLRGDLDWIAKKTLEKDRTRRYPSASELADDIRRHLVRDPVVAGPPTAIYRLARLVSKHRTAVGVLSVVFLSLLLGIVGTSIGLARAKLETARSKRAVDFLVDVLHDVRPERLGATLEHELRTALADPTAVPHREVLTAIGVRLLDENVLEVALARLDSQLADDEALQAHMRQAIGYLYYWFDYRDRAEPLLEQALEANRRVLGNGHERTLNAMNALGDFRYAQGRIEEAGRLWTEALDRSRKVFPADHEFPVTLEGNLAAVYEWRGELGEAERLARRSAEGRKRLLGDDHVQTLRGRANLAGVLTARGKHDEAIAILRGVAERTRQLAEDRLSLGPILRCKLGYALAAADRHAEALEVFEECRADLAGALGDLHPTTIDLDGNAALATARTGRPDLSEERLRNVLAAVDARVEAGRDVAPEAQLELRVALTQVLLQRSKVDEAIAGLEQILGDGELLEPERREPLRTALAKALVAVGRYDEGARHAGEAAAALREVLGAEDPATVAAVVWQANALFFGDRRDEAEPLYAAVLERVRQLQPDDWGLLFVFENLGRTRAMQGDLAGAAPLLEEAVERYRSRLGPDHVRAVGTSMGLADVLMAAGRMDEAEPWVKDALERCRRLAGEEASITREALDLAARLAAARKP